MEGGGREDEMKRPEACETMADIRAEIDRRVAAGEDDDDLLNGGSGRDRLEGGDDDDPRAGAGGHGHIIVQPPAMSRTSGSGQVAWPHGVDVGQVRR